MDDPWKELIEMVRHGAEVENVWGAEVREDGTVRGGKEGDYPRRRQVWIRRRVGPGLWKVTADLVKAWARERGMVVKARRASSLQGGWLILEGVSWRPD